MDITLRGRKAGKWDVMVKDEEGDGLYWCGINLCEVSRAHVLKGKGKKCFAEFE